jgi:hypothetical protein
MAYDSKGNIYAATGNEGKVLRMDPLGDVKTVLDTNELEVQAIAIDKSDNVYAATSPDGKIYKIKPDGTSQPFFDPEDKYIWSLAVDDTGNVYAGTGDQGKIYKIDSSGNGKLLIDTSETNITALAWDKHWKLLAGSDHNGILYSVEPSGKAFVLIDTEMQQISSIYSDPSGEIYFSAIAGIAAAPVRNPNANPAPNVVVPQQPPTPTSTDQGNDDNDEGDTSVTVEVGPTIVTQPTVSSQPHATGASQLYRINTDGFAELIYTADEDQIMDISAYKEGMVLLATGKKAKLIAVDANKKSTILLRAPEEQITSIIQINGRFYAATANPANIYELTEEHSSKGTYYSEVKDAQTTSTFGQITWKATVPVGTTLNLFTRSGNTRTPDDTWSDWTTAGTNPEGKRIENPRARYFQYKAEFNTTNAALSPVLRSVSIAYLQQNVRPQVLTINVQAPGILYRKQQIYPQESFAGLPEELQEDNPTNGASQVQTAYEISPLGKSEFRKGYRTITWNAVDQNRDDLKYDIYYRTEDQKEWFLLKGNLTDKVFAWDTSTMPDGTYLLKIVASDDPSNPAGVALNNFKISDPFDVDNSAPTIQVLKSSGDKSNRVLEVRATDQFSTIKELQYSTQPGEWKLVFPVDQINDSRSEDYRIEIKNPGPQIVFKCTDRVGNISTTKYSW